MGREDKISYHELKYRGINPKEGMGDEDVFSLSILLGIDTILIIRATT